MTFAIPGKYFRLMVTSAPVSVDFRKAGRSIGESAENVQAGYYAEPADGYEGFTIQSATAQTATVAISDGLGGYDRTVGDVTILGVAAVSVSNTGGAFSTTAPAVTNVDSQVLAANAVRRYLMVQNQDSTANVYLRFGGAANVGAGSIKLPPGGYLELAGYCSTDSLHAVADQAAAAVTAVEG